VRSKNNRLNVETQEVTTCKMLLIGCASLLGKPCMLCLPYFQLHTRTKRQGGNSIERHGKCDLPVCIPTKTPQLANDAASTRPVTKECTKSATSPYSLSTGPRIRRVEKKPGFCTLRGSGDALRGGEVSSAVAFAS